MRATASNRRRYTGGMSICIFAITVRFAGALPVKRNFNVGILLPFCELCHRIRDSCTTAARVV